MEGNKSSSLMRQFKKRWWARSLQVALFSATGAMVSVPAFGHHTGGFASKEIPAFIDELVRDHSLSRAELEGAFNSRSAFIDELVQEHGLSRTQLERVFNEVKYLPGVVRLISKPAERSLSWWEYRDRLINDARINKGVDFWIEHRDSLEKAEKKYGVSAAAVIGILGIETGFGQNSGGFRVIDALSTLGFGYPPRAKFFKKELKEFLILANKQGFDPLELKGSYAGAMGIPQFMPSSYRAYAIDFDGDGQVDIWKSPVDTIGSIASYLHQHGWVRGGGVAVRATVKGEKYEQVLSSNPRPTRSFQEVKRYGWQSTQVLPDSARVRALQFADEEKKNNPEYWLTLTNFYAITRYNKSDLYAMAVWQLGSQVEQKLKARLGAGATVTKKP